MIDQWARWIIYRTGLSCRNSFGVAGGTAARGEEVGLSMGLCALARQQPAEALPRALARGVDSRDDGGAHVVRSE